jgi:hypothetical protein
MKLRWIEVTLKMKTDIPKKWLYDKRRWQTLLDMMHDATKHPLANYAIVEKVMVKGGEHD